MDPSELFEPVQPAPTPTTSEKLNNSTDGLEQNPPSTSPTTTSAVEPKEDDLETLLEGAMRMQGTASLWELKKPFEFKVVGLSGVKWAEEDPSTQTFVQATLYVAFL